MYAYDEDYVYHVQKNLGNMLDFSVNTCDFDLQKFWDMFLVSGLDEQIETGNPKYLVGITGCELAKLVSEKSGICLTQEDEMYLDKSPEYWVGWAIGYYQWHSNKSFAKITKAVPIEELIAMYPTLHEADISKFVTIMDERLTGYYIDTNLKTMRMISGYSQSQLATESEVSLRQIQLFEQRQRDINKAQVITVFNLAKALSCRIEDLME